MTLNTNSTPLIRLLLTRFRAFSIWLVLLGLKGDVFINCVNDMQVNVPTIEDVLPAQKRLAIVFAIEKWKDIIDYDYFEHSQKVQLKYNWRSSLCPSITIRTMVEMDRFSDLFPSCELKTVDKKEKVLVCSCA